MICRVVLPFSSCLLHKVLPQFLPVRLKSSDSGLTVWSAAGGYRDYTWHNIPTLDLALAACKRSTFRPCSGSITVLD